MFDKRSAALVAAAALLAAAAMPGAQAQTVVPQMMAPMPPPPPGGLTIYHYSDAPVADPGDDPANWPARQNVVESDRYERLIRTDPAFRAARIRKECGSINEPGLYQQCVASFR
ncbi:MAG TPA: hypothetical protein VMB84_20745 [Stellaceae bacterium]|nr:hypothetical protein [Stellaceae bacterium]